MGGKSLRSSWSATDIERRKSRRMVKGNRGGSLVDFTSKKRADRQETDENEGDN